MKKKSTRLLIVALVVLIGIAVYIMVKNKKTDEATETTASTEVKLLDKTGADLKSFNLKGEGYDNTYVQDDKSVWAYSDPSIIVTPTDISDIATYVALVTATRTIIDNATDLAEYGLDKPVTVTATFKDNSTFAFLVGKEAPTGDARYIKLVDENKVYTISSYAGSRLVQKLEDVRVTSFPNIDQNQPADFFVLKGKDRPTIELVRNEVNDMVKDLGSSVYIMKQPYEKPRGVSGDTFNGDFLATFNAVKIDKFVDDNPTDLSKYGLDNPTLDVSIAIPAPAAEGEEVTDKTPRTKLHFLFGNNADDETIYFKVAELKSVYTTKISNIQKFLDVTAFQLLDKFIALVNIDKVDSFTVQTGEKEYLFEIKRTVKKGEKKADGTTAEDETIATYFINGKEIDEDAFKDIYQVVIGITGDVDAPAEALADLGTSVIEINYKINNGEPNVKVQYYPLDDNFYIGGRDGVFMYAVGERRITQLLQTLDAIQ